MHQNKKILDFRLFETLNALSKDQKEWLDKCTNGSWSIDVDGMVDVQGSFHCYRQGIVDFKGIRFGRVSDGFYCNENQLKSLEGSPKIVHGEFWCYDNNLDTLEGGPNLVGLNFYCYRNFLNSLEGSPSIVGKNFYCYRTPLNSLEGAPETIGGKFSSDPFDIPEGQWGLSGWLKVLEEGTPEAQKLIATLVSPEALNKRLNESPEKTMVALKGVWNSPAFAKIQSELKIPKGYEEEMDLLGDLDDIGM
jgi:hypothetical protein